MVKEHISMATVCVFLRCSDRFSKVRSPHLLPAGSESTVMPGAPPGSAAACWSSSRSTEADRRKDAFVSVRWHSGGGVTLIYQHTPRQERESGPSPCGYRCSGLPLKIKEGREREREGGVDGSHPYLGMLD